MLGGYKSYTSTITPSKSFLPPRPRPWIEAITEEPEEAASAPRQHRKTPIQRTQSAPQLFISTTTTQPFQNHRSAYSLLSLLLASYLFPQHGQRKLVAPRRLVQCPRQGNQPYRLPHRDHRCRCKADAQRDQSSRRHRQRPPDQEGRRVCNVFNVVLIEFQK